MSDDANAVPDVNTAPASSSGEQQNSQVATPPVENTGSSTPVAASPEGRIPYTRFQEVVSQKNEYASKIEALERRLGAYETNLVQNRQSNVAEDAVSKLVAAGLDANAAKLLVETQMSLMDTRVNEKVGPLEQRAARQEVDNWIRSFASDHTDYKALEPEMERVFASLPQNEQAFIAGSPKGLEMLYWQVKGQVSLKQVQSSQVAGATQAYNNIAQKAAMSATPGASVGNSNALTREAIKKMDNVEYAKRKAEIYDAYAKGTIK